MKKPIKKKKSNYFYVPIYRKRVCAYVGFTFDEMSKLFKKEWGENPPKFPNAGGYYFVDKGGGRFYGHHFLWVYDQRDMASFTHEIFHLTAGILRDVKLDFSESSEEAYAYLYGYLFERLKGKK